jgi:hypothetical protein
MFVVVFTAALPFVLNQKSIIQGLFRSNFTDLQNKLASFRGYRNLDENIVQ